MSSDRNVGVHRLRNGRRTRHAYLQCNPGDRPFHYNWEIRNYVAPEHHDASKPFSVWISLKKLTRVDGIHEENAASENRRKTVENWIWEYWVRVKNTLQLLRKGKLRENSWLNAILVSRKCTREELRGKCSGRKLSKEKEVESTECD